MVFPVVICGCESWMVKKAEHWRIDAFELWCWRKLLRVPLTERKSSKSILKEISPEYSLEGLMLKLMIQYSGHLMQRTDSLEKTLMLGKIEGRRRGGDRGWNDWMASSTQQTWIWQILGDSGGPEAWLLQPMGSQRVGHNWVTTTTIQMLFKDIIQENEKIQFQVDKETAKLCSFFLFWIWIWGLE